MALARWTWCSRASCASGSISAPRLAHSTRLWSTRTGGNMANAVVFIQSVELQCPHCKQPIVEPETASLYWTVEELEAVGYKVTCTECGKESKVRKLK